MKFSDFDGIEIESKLDQIKFVYIGSGYKHIWQYILFSFWIGRKFGINATFISADLVQIISIPFRNWTKYDSTQLY